MEEYYRHTRSVHCIEAADFMVGTFHPTGRSSPTWDNFSRQVDPPEDCSDSVSEWSSRGEEDEETLVYSIYPHLGYQWGSDSKYWMLWTLWDPEVHSSLLKSTSKLQEGEANYLKAEVFTDVINASFSSICSDYEFRHLKPLEMRTIVVRLNLTKGEEHYKAATNSVEMKASELIFNQGTVSYRFQPITVIACAGLAEILRAVCKSLDILIISGTYKKERDSDGATLLLLNFDNVKGYLQILRLPPTDAEVFMVEKIKPKETDGRFQISYFVRSPTSNTRQEVTLNQHFQWKRSFEEFYREFTKRSSQLADFAIPIQFDQDPEDVYRVIISKDFHLVPPNTRTPDSTPVKSSKKNRPSQNTKLPDGPDMEKDCPVFFSHYPSTPVTSRRPTSNVRMENTGNPERNPEHEACRRNRDRNPDPEPLENEDEVFPKVFETVGKLAVFITVACIFFLMLCVLCSPFCHGRSRIPCQTPVLPVPGNLTFTKESVNQTASEPEVNFFTKICQYFISVGFWVGEHCGLWCLLERFRLTYGVQGPPIV